jgi:hypothetical protein
MLLDYFVIFIFLSNLTLFILDYGFLYFVNIFALFEMDFGDFSYFEYFGAFYAGF